MSLNVILHPLIALLVADAATIRGVVWSNDCGVDANASCQVELATKSGLYRLYYWLPLTRNFARKSCLDIGAVWSVRFHVLSDSSRVIDTGKCDGDVDPMVHSAWLIVRRYLRSPMALVSSQELFSDRWRNSDDPRQLKHWIAGLDTSDYDSFGKRGTCIDVVSVHVPDTTVFSAGPGCFLKVGNKRINLVFTVIRGEAGISRIDRIEIE